MNGGSHSNYFIEPSVISWTLFLDRRLTIWDRVAQAKNVTSGDNMAQGFQEPQAVAAGNCPEFIRPLGMHNANNVTFGDNQAQGFQWPRALTAGVIENAGVHSVCVGRKIQLAVAWSTHMCDAVCSDDRGSDDQHDEDENIATEQRTARWYEDLYGVPR